MRTIVARAGSAVFVVSLVVSCQAIISGDLPAFTCDPSKPDVCPKGQYCKGAGCSACEKTDPCDGYDNDCNGIIDDGTDVDMDGYHYCGPEPIDCDDNDATIHPNAKEICNGKDDNCNRLIDEDVCVAPERCAPKIQRCVANPCDPNDASSCKNNTVCDPGSLQCVAPATKKLGQGCANDTECETGLCAGSNVLANKLGAGAVCAKTCCTSNDCPMGFVCFGPGTGGNYCLSAAAINRSVTGATQAGAPAARASECRSGVMDAVANRCLDTCCSDKDCASGSSCLPAQLDGHAVLACTSPFGSGGQDADCGANKDCHAGVCYPFSILYNACVTPCCGSSSCGKVIFGSTPTACWDVKLNSGDYVPVCQHQKSGGGNAAVGAFCMNNSDCRSDRCYSGYCSDVCCVDSDCGSPSMVCRPVDLTGNTALRCVKK